LAELRKNVDALNNRAIFEIPEILDKLLLQSGDAQAPQLGATNLQPVR
jgi:hypothetical protein